MSAMQLLSPAGSDAAAGPALALAITRFPCVVGRHSGCDLRLNDPEISRRHCAFALREARVWVKDLGSLNGTRLNGEPLEGARPVADGDWLELGRLRFRVRLDDAEEEAIDLGNLPGDAEGPTRPKLA